MKFTLGVDEFVFEDPSQYPAEYPVQMMQVVARSAAGTIHTETYATPISTRVLNFVNMSKTDVQGMLNWYIDTSNGMANEFEFTDEVGDVFTARFTDSILSPQQTSFERYSLKVNLEVSGAV